jgi:DNA-binding winged helix-turn-helix (wHTH) protein
VLELPSRAGVLMDKGNRSEQILRFGVFEADLQSGELRKNGLKVPLQDQPFQVFATLLERPGELVTREELRRKVWPQDTFVDFDHALNTAINKIRAAMGDDADNPRFVETRPRRGYRFIAPVNKPIPQLAPQLATIVPPKTPSAWFSSRWTWLGVANCARPWIGRLTVVSWRFRREAQTSFTPGFPCFGFPIRSRALSYPLRNRSLT